MSTQTLFNFAERTSVDYGNMIDSKLSNWRNNNFRDKIFKILLKLQFHYCVVNL